MATKYIIKLYVIGQTETSQKAINNLRDILESDFKGLYDLTIINLLENPQLAEADKILATPTVIRILPLPVRRIIGDLSDKEKVLLGLDLTTKAEG